MDSYQKETHGEHIAGSTTSCTQSKARSRWRPFPAWRGFEFSADSGKHISIYERGSNA